MLIFPAIDLIGGQAVRLVRGDYDQKTVFDTDPVHVAETFRMEGAGQIHLVDLDGAKSGGTPNFDTIRAIKDSTGLFCEIGGGIRDMAATEKYLEAGLDRVILGTAAVRDPAFLESAVKAYGDRIAVGVDLRDGMVAIHGWTETSGLDCFAFCDRMCELGVSTVICTDISRDGAMRGTNLALYRELSGRYRLNITASGGVSSLEDVKALRGMDLYGAIIGKAWYLGSIDLKQAIEVAR